MEIVYKTYASEIEQQMKEHKIATLSNLNLHINTTLGELNDLFLNIYDQLPDYIFLLGNMFPYYYLEDNNFKKNILHLYKLLTVIAKVYVVFGEVDYKLEDNRLINENYLTDFYQNLGITVLNNKVLDINNILLIGYNRNPSLYSKSKIITLKDDILEFIKKIEYVLTSDKYKIFLTNSSRDLLKLELDFFKHIDLILASQLPNLKEIKSLNLNIKR